MPVILDREQVPAPTRVVTASKWSNLSAIASDFFNDDKLRDAKGIGFNAEDGVDSENWKGAAQAIRGAAKALGWKVRLRWDDGVLYATSDGPFVARGPRVSAQESNGSDASTTSSGSKSRGQTASGASKSK